MASIRSGIGENMEDRYLYKAKTTPKEKGEFNNVWVTGNLIVSNGKYYIHPVGNVVNVKNEIGRIIVMHEVIPDTICRCTGLKDRNGKLIWENDIMVAHLDEDYPEDETYIKIIWHGNGFYVMERGGKDITLISKSDQEYFEVCGNIFDNPELLGRNGE
jgi:uncharacterized phage protein (TIGR01671 family)